MSFSSYILNQKLREVDQELALPPRISLIQATDSSSGWISHYGGLRELANYSKIFSELPVRFNATWQHGVFAEYRYRRYPELILYGVNHKPDRLILVATQHQTSCLNSIGYTNVHAVGLPFIYAKPSNLPKRKQGSVLAMPAHSLDGSPFESEQLIDTYAMWLADKYAKQFGSMYACIHMSCIRNGQWWPAFLDKKINVVGGADHQDANSYSRMWSLFSRFDTVTTNNIGSHLYYALAAGCKVVIEGPDVPLTKKQLMNDATYQRMAQKGMTLTGNSEANREIELVKTTFSKPRRGIELGNDQIGACNQKSPSEVRSLLEWRKRDQICDASLSLAKDKLNLALKFKAKGSIVSRRFLSKAGGQR